VVSVSNCTLVLGVTGSIAAYKAVDLVWTLSTAGAGFASRTEGVKWYSTHRPLFGLTGLTEDCTLASWHI